MDIFTFFPKLYNFCGYLLETNTSQVEGIILFLILQQHSVWTKEQNTKFLPVPTFS